jgi:transposase
MRPKGSSAELERRRRRAVALLDKGMKAAHVAKAVGVSRASVTRWRDSYQGGGEQALAAHPHPGRRPKLTARQRERLAKLLLEGPGVLGYPTELWTLRRVAEVVEHNFGVHYHPGHVWYLLRSMDWTCQKPERRARERDEEAIAKWRTERWPDIKKRPPDRPKHRLSR